MFFYLVKGMRIDNYLVENGFFDSRTKAKQAIERGEIFIKDTPITKASFEIKNSDADIKRVCANSYVSIGGFKLEKALKYFNYSVDGLICADIGASTGGFTDCLLQNGAEMVYAVDLNDELLHSSLKKNDRVKLIVENVKNLTKKFFNCSLDLIVADLSFISITQAIPILADLIDDGKALITLIKPQFETGEKRKFKNGVIRDKKIQLEACYKAYDCALFNSLNAVNFTTAPINDDKNVEFLMLFVKNAKTSFGKSKIIF